MPLISHPQGGYHFLPGIAPYSCGVISSPGYEIVHVTLAHSVNLMESGFSLIEKYLYDVGRPKAAMCGMELRCPKPYSFQGFKDFNQTYQAVLKSWDLFVENVNPVARTNVAPVVTPPDVPQLYGFSFTKPTTSKSPTFVVAGGGELPEGVLDREGIVQLANLSSEGIRGKANFVMGLMTDRLLGMGVNWDQATRANVYTSHAIEPLMREVLLEQMGMARFHGVHWYYTFPPIQEIEFEMDVRGVRTEVVLGQD